MYFVDGSVSIDPDTGEKQHVGASVVMMEEEEYEVLIKKTLPSHYSAQAAELIALIEALHAAKGCVVTIYSDSAYLTTTVHAGLSRWRRRGFRKAGGSPVQHAELLNKLIEALSESSVVAIVKCQAHTHNEDEISLGNAATDAALKQAPHLPIPMAKEYIMKEKGEEKQAEGYNTLPIAEIIELQKKSPTH
ncbi:ribonuclease H-like [Ambystoma mexicanum]|uniref:ribonuclease H-like n=1 Tax=Ambystoma mexicanum TaxID=8296 RepID=UPI0037E974DB